MSPVKRCSKNVNKNPETSSIVKYRQVRQSHWRRNCENFGTSIFAHTGTLARKFPHRRWRRRRLVRGRLVVVPVVCRWCVGGVSVVVSVGGKCFSAFPLFLAESTIKPAKNTFFFRVGGDLIFRRFSVFQNPIPGKFWGLVFSPIGVLAGFFKNRAPGCMLIWGG